ncbi:MAG: nucleotidyltransferase domain-containing protein, partial [Gammaproteobacteria bacterium]
MRAPASSVARPEPNPFESAEAAALARQTLNVGGLGIDWDRIDATLADPAARLDDYRSLLRSANAALGQLFLANTPIEQLVRDRAAVVDRVIQSAWNRYAAQLQKRVSLVAVGGYGRHELHPSSDVDLLFILPDRKPRQYGQSIATFLAFLWDIGLEVGHSARTVAECREESKRDMTIATSVMESRLLAGPEEL